MKKAFLPLLIASFMTILAVFFFCPAGKSVAEEKTHTLTFYDRDRVSVLESYTITSNDEAIYIADLLDEENAGKYGDISIHNLIRLLNGYNVTGWDLEKRTGPEEEFQVVKTYKPLTLARSESKNFRLDKYDLNCYAVYSTNPVDFPIDYVVNKGTLPSSAVKTVNVSKSVKLASPSRKGYTFEGWFLNQKCSPLYKVTKLTADELIELDYRTDACDTIPSISVYAKWKSATPAKISIKSLTNSKSGKVAVKLNKASTSPKAYELIYSTDKAFAKNVHTAEFGPDDSIVVANLTKDKKYYFKVRAYNIDSAKSRAYCDYSSVKTITISKGASEVKPTSSSASLDSVRVSGSSTKYLNVTATVKKRVKSYDDFYYLVKVDPITGKYSTHIASCEKSSSLSFRLPLVDSKGNNYYAGKFAIAVQTKKDTYTLISSAKYIENPTAAATYKAAYPTPVSKKGRQGDYVKDDGDKNFFYNVTLNSIISTKADGGEAFKYNGKTYYFKIGSSSLENRVRYVNSDGGTVTLQVMLTYDEANKKLIKASARSDRSKRYYAFNVEDAASRNKIEAAFYWLTQHFSQPNMHVDNWILGNEVNTFKNPEGWFWAGNVSYSDFINNYAQTFRILYYAAVSNNKNARVFTCVDHTFNDRGYDWGVKNYLVSFNSACKNLTKSIKWNLAYHAYSAVLTNADFWNDDTSSLYTVNSTYDTSYVTPLNIEVITKYVREKFGKNVHIILSEQAFSSTGGTNPPVNKGRASGEKVQAAAVAYLFYKAMFNDDIDAVIFSHPYDNLGPGMDFALKSPAYSVYKYMDTPKYGSYTTECIGTISRTGHNKVTSWKNIVPNFSDAKLRSMPSR